MSNLKEWAAGKRVLTILGARELLSSADAMVALIESVSTGKGLDLLPPISNLSTWLSFYKDHMALQNTFFDICYPTEPEEPPTSVCIREAQKFFRKLGRMPKEKFEVLLREAYDNDGKELQRDLAEGAAEGQEMVHKQDEELKDYFDGIDPDEKQTDLLAKSSAMGFFMRVWMPCWFLYHEYPTTLFAKARRLSNAEDRDALTKLVKLDKTVLFEPRIASQVHKWGHAGNRSAFRKIAREFSARPKKMSRKIVKNALLGLAARLFGNLEPNITTKDFVVLLDAVSIAKSKGKYTCDIDFANSGIEDIRRQIARDIAKWKIFPQPGQK